MSDIIRCPNCDADHDMSYYPDHHQPGGDGKVDFECEHCGATFEMWVDFEPCFTVDRSSMKTPVIGP